MSVSIAKLSKIITDSRGFQQTLPLKEVLAAVVRLLISAHLFTGLLGNNFPGPQQVTEPEKFSDSCNPQTTCYLPSILTNTEDTVTGSIGVPVWK